MTPRTDVPGVPIPMDHRGETPDPRYVIEARGADDGGMRAVWKIDPEDPGSWIHHGPGIDKGIRYGWTDITDLACRTGWQLYRCEVGPSRPEVDATSTPTAPLSKPEQVAALVAATVYPGATFSSRYSTDRESYAIDRLHAAGYEIVATGRSEQHDPNRYERAALRALEASLNDPTSTAEQHHALSDAVNAARQRDLRGE